MRIIFDWDERKNGLNKKKHGIAFEDAVAVFDSSLSRLYQDYEHGEERYVMVGILSNSLVMVVHTSEEVDDGCTLVRIISARKLTSQERKDYEDDI